MVKITHKEVSKLIGKSAGYTRVLLHNNGIFIKQGYIEALIDFILKYRSKK